MMSIVKSRSSRVCSISASRITSRSGWSKKRKRKRRGRSERKRSCRSSRRSNLPKSKLGSRDRRKGRERRRNISRHPACTKKEKRGLCSSTREVRQKLRSCSCFKVHQICWDHSQTIPKGKKASVRRARQNNHSRLMSWWSSGPKPLKAKEKTHLRSETFQGVTKANLNPAKVLSTT